MTDYDDDWIGRYHAVRSELKTVNINPSLAFEATDWLSVGAGISAQYISVELTNAIDFGLLDAIGAFRPIPPRFFGLQPGEDDGFSVAEGDDWSFGYNFGVLLNLAEGTRLGIHYRSSIRHTVRGDADFTVPAGIEELTGAFVDTGVEATSTLPETLSVSVFHELLPSWAIAADITWTGWSRLEELRLEFDNPLQPDGVSTMKWKDSLRYAVGIEHAPKDRWILRVGLAYDETPVPNARLRSPRIPDSDRLWLAAGLGYRHSDRVSLDLGYAHLFGNDPEIDSERSVENSVRGFLKGKYDASVDIVAAQLSVSF